MEHLYETVAELIEPTDVPNLVAEVKAVLEVSHQQTECILSLPVEDTCWCIGGLEFCKLSMFYVSYFISL